MKQFVHKQEYWWPRSTVSQGSDNISETLGKLINLCLSALHHGDKIILIKLLWWLNEMICDRLKHSTWQLSAVENDNLKF